MFSETVDEVVARVGHVSPRTKNLAIGFVRATLRECQVQPGGKTAYFARDLTEEEVTAAGTNFNWTIPLRFRLLRTAWYKTQNVYPEGIRPSPGLKGKTAYFYQATDYFVFNGTVAGEMIGLAYYTYTPKFDYYPVGERPAKFNFTGGTWEYLSNGQYVNSLSSVVQNEAAQELVYHWLLGNWQELVIIGAMAKVRGVLDDNQQVAAKDFAMYKSMQQDLLLGEGWESLNRV